VVALPFIFYFAPVVALNSKSLPPFVILMRGPDIASVGVRMFMPNTGPDSEWLGSVGEKNTR
jgi:hypothetical protein